MSYNINFGIPGDAPTIAAIRAANPDIVFLEESNARWEEALRAELGGVYPHAAFHHWSGAGGLGVLSRLRFSPLELLRPEGDGWFPAWRLLVESPLGRLQVLVVHLRPPVSDGGSFVVGHFTVPAVHEREIAGFADALDPALPTLVVGDFNEEEDGRALAYLRARRFDDAIAAFAPGRPTWHWSTAVGTFERQLDHLLYDRATVEPLSAEILRAGSSDHFPVIGVFARR
jgi:endonuclease/exonuclease/phosphatase (EEP) superfamily protein YafD